MSQEQIALTPAAQMKLIREAVYASQNNPDEDPQMILASYLSRLDILHERVSELETHMRLHEEPFTSNAPVVGPLLVRLRYAWNWMSTRWYVLPILGQQNRYNKASTQAMRDMLTTMEALLRQIQALQMRVAELEQADSAQSARQE